MILRPSIGNGLQTGSKLSSQPPGMSPKEERWIHRTDEMLNDLRCRTSSQDAEKAVQGFCDFSYGCFSASRRRHSPNRGRIKERRVIQ